MRQGNEAVKRKTCAVHRQAVAVHRTVQDLCMRASSKRRWHLESYTVQERREGNRVQIIIKMGGRISLLFYFAHNCAHLRTISHHFLYIKLYDVIGKSIVFIQSVPRFIRGAFFNTKLKRVDIVGFNTRRECKWLCRAEIRKI